MIRTANYRTTRPIVKLYPLEVADSVDDVKDIVQDHEAISISDAIDPPPVSTRQKRTAATNALNTISGWAEILRRPPEDVE